MKIRVTQEHIDRGVPKKCSMCPVALAIIDALSPSPKFSGVSVAQSRIVFWRGPAEKEIGIDTPLPAHDFIFAYDAGIPVSPFEFELAI